MQNLKIAVEASLPLIAITTTDTINVADVLAHVTGKKFIKSDGKVEAGDSKSPIMFIVQTKRSPDLDWDHLYIGLVKQERTLVIVNPKEMHSAMHDAGVLTPTKQMVIDLLVEVTNTEAKAVELAACLGGCTLKEVAELARVTMTRDHSLTAKGLIHSRKMFFTGSRAVALMDTGQHYYLPDPQLMQWEDTERKYFLTSKDYRLAARGLLLAGKPGVGKTEFTKWLANTWGIPAYRLDLAATMDKYQGESERYLREALSLLEREQPCIMLIDEVEKMSATKGVDNSTGTSTNMLSQLLWWLAEHRERVLTIMTTNNKDKLPPELFRPGRIDKVITLAGLAPESVPLFCKSVLDTYAVGFEDDEAENEFLSLVQTVAEKAVGYTNGDRIPQAALVDAVKTCIKSHGFI